MMMHGHLKKPPQLIMTNDKRKFSKLRRKIPISGTILLLYFDNFGLLYIVSRPVAVLHVIVRLDVSTLKSRKWPSFFCWNMTATVTQMGYSIVWEPFSSEISLGWPAVHPCEDCGTTKDHHWMGASLSRLAIIIERYRPQRGLLICSVIENVWSEQHCGSSYLPHYPYVHVRLKSSPS